MSNPWLAIDVATAPAARAREVRRAWERFLRIAGDRFGGVEEAQVVRDPITASWRRSAAAGVDPWRERIAPVVSDEDETQARWEIHPLAGMAPLIRSCLAASADESRHLIVVSDARGVLLWVEGNARVRLRAADSMNFAEGTLWSEEGAGTNAIGTAIAAEHAVQVFASEHFNEVVQAWTCAAAPVRDPDTGAVVGVIDLTGEMRTVHPHSLAVATATSRAVEAELRCRMLDRDRRRIERWGHRLGERAGPAALVAPGGRVIAGAPSGWLAEGRLSVPVGGGGFASPSGRPLVAEVLGHEEAYLVGPAPFGEPPRGLPGPGARARRRPGTAGAEGRQGLELRLLARPRGWAQLDGEGRELRLRHSEILAILCGHPAGIGSERLSREIYGTSDQSPTVRVEVSRLRKLLGGRLEVGGGYRLPAGTSSDLGAVWGLLRRGQIREACERYPGPLLPASEAPGVVREREALEGCLRRSAMACGDLETLWAWLQSESGRDDALGWRRLLVGLPFQDVRRSLAAVRVDELRRAGV